MSLKLITPPATEPITLNEAKLHLRVDGTDEDTMITALIVAARRMAEQRTERALITQTWELALDVWDDEIELPMPPVASITSIKYIDTDGVEQTLANTEYTLDSYGTMGHSVKLAYGKTWPSIRYQDDAIKIRYAAGYGTAADVPQDLKAWLYLAIGTLYAQRESVVQYAGAMSPLPDSFWQSLLDPYLTY
jgi:uncharacterized phiE125 gp8 family phage protein